LGNLAPYIREEWRGIRKCCLEVAAVKINEAVGKSI